MPAVFDLHFDDLKEIEVGIGAIIRHLDYRFPINSEKE